MNIRQFDSRVAMLEGKKKAVSIGNVREVRARIFELLRDMTLLDLLKLLKWKG